MDKLRATSRCIVSDPVYQRVSQVRYKNHLQSLKKPYGTSMHASIVARNSLDKTSQYALQISRYKKAQLTSAQNIDPVIVQNRSLVKKMQQIDKRKSHSVVNLKVPHTSKHKLLTQKIRQQNKHIFGRIKIERQNLITKKELKKQFAEVDKMIMHSRRIKQTIRKVKKAKKLPLFKLKNQQDELAFTSGQRKQITPLNLR